MADWIYPGLQNWTLWCSDTSSPFSPPDSRAQSWQRGSRVTATCCPSADASNRLTLKTRAPERWREKNHLFPNILFFSVIPSTSPREARIYPHPHTPPSLIACTVLHAVCRLDGPLVVLLQKKPFLCSLKPHGHIAVLLKLLLSSWVKYLNILFKRMMWITVLLFCCYFIVEIKSA